MKSLFLKNFVGDAVIILLSLIIVITGVYGIGRAGLVQNYQTDMKRESEEIARVTSLLSELDSTDDWMVNTLLTSISGATGDYICIINQEGTILACSDGTPFCSHLGTSIPGEIYDRVLFGSDIRQPSEYGSFFSEPNYLEYAEGSISEGGTIFVIVASSVSHIVGRGGNFFVLISIVVLAAFVILLVAFLLYSRLMTRPIDEIAAASSRFAKGDFSVRVKQVEAPESEIGLLIESFNSMADSLETSEKRRTDFIANVSHELRTPMTTIAGFADGLLDGTIPEAESEKYLCTIRDETRRLARLVRDMLEASRARVQASDVSRRTSFDLTELTVQTLLSFENRAMMKNLDVDPQLPDTAIMVTADKDSITRVIYNLLDNAVKFAAVDSCITIRLYKDAGLVYVSVIDQGETIPPDDIPYIFDRFHKSDRSRSLDKDGVGLGLSFVKEIINSHNGDIVVKSENGTTEFVFTLPLNGSN